MAPTRTAFQPRTGPRRSLTMSDTTFPLHPGATAAEAPAARPAALPRRPRLWPGVVIVALMWPLILVPGWVAPGTMTQFMAMFWGPLIAAGAVLAWWLFAGRVRWSDRLLVPLACAALAVAAHFLSEPSFRFMLIIYVLPAVLTAWVLWLLVTPALGWPVRRAGLLALFVLVWGCATLLRMDGITGSMSASVSFRWSPTPEDRFLADLAAEGSEGASTVAAPAAPIALGEGDWPGFRGAARDGVYRGGRVRTDWNDRPPEQLWRRRVGPGWSSFAVVGKRLYTQEQRGRQEAVVCYHADTGKQLWAHLDDARFTEVVS